MSTRSGRRYIDTQRGGREDVAARPALLRTQETLNTTKRLTSSERANDPHIEQVFCSPEQWREVIRAPTTKQANLQHCTARNEQVPKPVSRGVALQRLAPAALVDAATSVMESRTCSSLSTASKDKQRKFVENLMQQFNMDYKQIPECENDPDQSACLNRYDTVDKFFTRELYKDSALKAQTDRMDRAWMQQRQRQGLPVPPTPNPHVIGSPAQCYAVAYPDTTAAQRFWIKGKQYTVDALLGKDHRRFYNFFDESHSTFVLRLSPAQYHRFRAPVAAQPVAIARLGTRHLSVQPRLVRDPRTNVLTENVRYIVYLQTERFGILPMVVVGATCVTSVTFADEMLNEAFRQIPLSTDKTYRLDDLNLRRPAKRIDRLDEFGSFHYGGSTIVLLIRNEPTTGGRNEIFPHLLEASQQVDVKGEPQPVETEIDVGQPLMINTAL